MAIRRITPLLLLTLVMLVSPTLQSLPASRAASAAVQTPVLKWQKGGCYNSWCETGWYSSPAVADLDGNGTAEVISGAYSLFILNGTDGSLVKKIDPPDSGGRIWPGVVVADLQGDGQLEIVTAQGGGFVSIYDHTGAVLHRMQPTPGNELRSLAVYDLENDGSLEIIVASTRSEDQWFVYEPDGSLRPSQWPQLSASSPGYAAGCFNQNVAAGDLDGDRRAEILAPNDTHYLDAFQDDGSQLPASAIYGLNPDDTPKAWSQVGLHVDFAVDVRGWANCGSEHRPNMAASAPLIVDLNGDHKQEAIVVGNVHNCGTDPYTDLYEMVFILNGDRTRFNWLGHDWTAIPVPEPNAGPISEDWNVIESNQPNPVTADLDGDGLKEILYPSYDGRLHAYWLDKTEHGSWPFSVYNPADGVLRFASEPVVADLDNDTHAEVIFTSWVQKGSHQTGKLFITDYLGNLLQAVDLPPAFGSPDWNGGLAAPTLANLDADPDLEVVVNTAHSGFVAYDLPGTTSARILWGTGRGSYQRSGSFPYQPPAEVGHLHFYLPMALKGF